MFRPTVTMLVEDFADEVVPLECNEAVGLDVHHCRYFQSPVYPTLQHGHRDHRHCVSTELTKSAFQINQKLLNKKVIWPNQTQMISRDLELF